MALSVRVGSAHVSVNAAYNPASLKKVGEQIENQLEGIGTRIEKQLVGISNRNGKLYRSMGSDIVAIWRGALGAIVTSAPLMGSAISALSGGVTMLAGSLWSTVVAATATLPLLTSVGIAAGTAKVAFQGFGTALSAADPDELAAALANLSPAAADSAIAVRSLSDEAHALRLAVQENFFAGLSDSIEELGSTLMPVATAGMAGMATVLNGLAQSILDYVNSGVGLNVINQMFTNSTSIVKTLSGAVVPFLDGFLRLVNALSPAAERLAGRIADIALRFQGWTHAEGFADRIDVAMRKAEKTAGLLFDVIGNLGGAIGNIFEAANPSTNTFLEMLGDVTARFEEFTASVGGRDAIVKWAEESIVVLEQFGSTVRTMFEVIQDLSDPRVITSFLATVEEAFSLLGNLPLESIVSSFADWAEALQPISGPMLAIIIAGVSLQMMLGSLMGQMAGAAGVFAGFRAVIGRIGPAMDKFKAGFAGLSSGAGKHATSFGKFSAVLGKLGGILAKGLKFAGLAGLVVTIVSVIAKSEELQGKLKSVWGAIKGVFESLGSAFSGVASSAGPLLSSLDPIFAIFEKIVGIGVGLVLDTIRFAFESLGRVIEGAGTIISGFLTILTGIFTLDFSMILDGLKTVVSGIPALLQGLFGLFVTFFAPAKLLGLASKFFGGLLTGLRAASPGIAAFISNLITNILTFFVSLGPRLLSVGGSAMRSLGSGISAGFTAVRTVIVNFITSFVATLRTGLSALGGVVSSAMSGIRTVFTAVWNGVVIAVRLIWDQIMAAFNFYLGALKAVWNAGLTALRWVVDEVFIPIGVAIRGVISTAVDVIRASMELITAYWRIGWDAVSTVVRTVLAYIGGAIRAGMNTARSIVSSVMNAIRSVFSSVWNAISSTVRSVLNTVGGAIRSGLNAARSVVVSVLNTIRSTFSSVWNAVSSTVRSVLSAIGSAISSRMSAARAAITSAMNTIRTSIKSAFDAARNAVKTAMTAIGTAVSTGISKVLSTIRSLPGKIVSALGNLGSLLTSAGRDLISGLVSGITGSLGAIGGAMGGVASKIRSYLPFSPVKEGPLRAWNNGKPGKELMKMLAGGIDTGARQAENAMSGVASRIAGAAPRSLPLPALTGSPSRAGGASMAVSGAVTGMSGTNQPSPVYLARESVRDIADAVLAGSRAVAVTTVADHATLTRRSMR